MIIVLLLLFQSLCLYCQRLVLHVHDRCFPRNARLLQESAETVGDRKALQHLEHLQLEQSRRRHKRRILEPILPLGAGLNLEACRFCAHSPQGYCRHHFHLQLHTQRRNGGGAGGTGSGGDQDFKQLRRIRRELKRSLEPRSSHRIINYLPYSRSTSSLSSGYGSQATLQEELEETSSYLVEGLEETSSYLEEQQQQQREETCSSYLQELQEDVQQEVQVEQLLITSHL
ncbi:uncharacterized protein [Drosophila virilis]|uniref:Uncharacterized protein n=1 Tax=Drosophila virilis TaxID=7244 RepID=B4LTV3_DROVI|nr:uncharacterized protein LOC6628675 [Drosophila virilis]EDW64004.1 uncharacterized protein Dvir_GJ17225 [Drosophila virilis]